MPGTDSNGSVADSKRAADTILIAETSRGTQTQIRTDDFRLDDPEMNVDLTPAARNFAEEASHALRRHWFRMLLAGLSVGSLVAVGLWFGLPRLYTATAVLRVSMGQSAILEPHSTGEGMGTFDVYKRTQKQFLRSPAILTAALQREPVSRLPLVTQQTDPSAWLQKIVTVTFPDESEIMHVSVRCEDQKTAETLADTIVEVYLLDVVDVERQEKLLRIENLRKAETETETDLRKKRTALRQMADTLGTSDSEALTLAQKNTLEQYGVHWRQLNQVESELKRAERAKQIRDRAGPKDPDAGIWVSDAESESAVSMDPMIGAAKAHLDRLQVRIDETRKSVFGAAEAEYVAGFQAAIDRAKKRIEVRKGELRKELARRKQAAEESGAQSVDVLKAQQADLAKKVAELVKEAEKFGRSSVDVELMRAELKALDSLHDRLQRELRAANIEIASLRSRVVKLSPASALVNDDQNRRLMLSASFGGFGLLAGCASVVLWDLRRRRLNTLHEIADALRLPVLGTLPHVPRLESRNGSSLGLDEAVHGIAARLIFAPSSESQQVVLVTSASASEGKTTVAVNLATSFAGMGRRTVLVDFDLRRPTLHSAFDVDLNPGIGGVLKGQAEPLATVRATSVENLFLLPAGEWGDRGLSARNDEQVKKIVSELREAFVHVVIDAGPVLPIVDTRVVARHADGVVFSLLRDVTEIPKVESACGLLRSFDIRILGAVMIGAPGEVYYTRTIAKQTEEGTESA
jgi:succinoglycan biosynthesis transport protein ExoP